MLALNWKMNPTSVSEVEKLMQAMKVALAQIRTGDVVVFPPAMYIDLIIRIKESEQIYLELGVQDVAVAEKGAYTSQISANMAAGLGLQYALVGHSETHQYLGVTDASVGQKVAQVLQAGMNPMICIGYQEDKSSQEIDYDMLKTQLQEALEPSKELITNQDICIAYEPVWAIGTGVTPTPEMIETVIIYLKRTVQGILGAKTAENIRFLYGGSVNSGNIEEFNALPELDGFLIGGASLKPEELPKLAQVVV